jgi:integrase
MPLMAYGDGSLFERKSGPRKGWWVKRYPGLGSASWPHRPTRAQVDAKRIELSRSSQSLPATDTETVAEYLSRWLRDGLPEAKPRTVRGYRTIVELHIVPVLGPRALSELSPPDVQRFVNDVSATRSARTALHILACLRAALSCAVRWGVLRANPADHVRAPHVPHKEPVILSPEQTRTLLAQVRGDPLEALYVLAAMTGMRQAEILGLRWAAVNLTARTLSVEAALWWRPVTRAKPTDPAREPVLIEPKTERSRRTIHLPDRALVALKKHRKAQMGKRREVDAGLVFTQPGGTALEPSAVYRALRRHLAAAKLPLITFHALRHGTASMLLADGMPVGQVSELLGHANPTVTWNIYGHQLDKARRETADRMGTLLGEGIG